MSRKDAHAFAASLAATLMGVDSGRGQDDTLSAISVSPDDICDGVFRDAEVAGDPSV